VHELWAGSEGAQCGGGGGVWDFFSDGTSQESARAWGRRRNGKGERVKKKKDPAGTWGGGGGGVSRTRPLICTISGGLSGLRGPGKISGTTDGLRG